MLNAIVTGASSGIGKDICKKLIYLGYLVIGISRKNPSIDKLIWIKADLSKKEEIESVIQEIKEKFKSINLLINNAAIMKTNKILNLPFEDISESLILNVCSPIYITSLLTKLLIKGKASVVFIGSVASELDIPGELIYSTTKAALSKVNSGFASELTRLGIKFIEIRPSICKTPMTADLDQQSIDYMISKTSNKKLLDLDSISKTVISCISLPITSSGSIIYCGGIKR